MGKLHPAFVSPTKFTLQVIAAASRAAGLDGCIRVTLPAANDPNDGRGLPAQRVYLTYDEVEALDWGDALDELECGSVDCRIYGKPGDDGRRPVHGAAVLFAMTTPDPNAWPNGYGHVEDDDEASRRTPLGDHADLLRGLRIGAELNEGYQWKKAKSGAWLYDIINSEFDATGYSLWSAVVFDHALHSNHEGYEVAKSALDSLSVLENHMKASITWTMPLLACPWKEMYYQQCLLIGNPIEAAQTLAQSPEQFRELADRWEHAGRNPKLFKRLNGNRPGQGEPIRFLVPGLVPMGRITLLAGASGVGKSTLAHELVHAAATDPSRDGGPVPIWLGVPLSQEKAGGVAALVSGEDDDQILSSKSDMLDPECRSNGRILLITGSEVCLEAILSEELEDAPSLRLVVVDPARSFIEGSEDGSDNVSRFFDRLKALADRKGCAVVVIHHLSKKSETRSLDELRQCIRGSSVFVDRPRMVLGMYRKRKSGPTMIGVVKHNFPPGCGVTKGFEIAAQRDEATLRHVPCDDQPVQRLRPAAGPAAVASRTDRGVQGRAGRAGDAALVERLVSAVADLNGRGQRVTRTGPKGLFNTRHPMLADISRNALERIANLAQDEGRINVGPDSGLIANSVQDQAAE